jgi:hypothetical protein
MADGLGAGSLRKDKTFCHYHQRFFAYVTVAQGVEKVFDKPGEDLSNGVKVGKSWGLLAIT